MSLKKLLSVTALLLGLSSSAFAANVIKVGVYLPLTGQNAFGGQLELEGVELAHKEMPEVLGQKVDLVIVDNKSDKVEAANAVTRLTAKENVNAIIGTYGSSLALAGGEVAEKAKTPVVGTSCTNPMVTKGKRYYFRSGFIDPYQGAGAATYALDTLKAKKAAVLKDISNDYAIGLAKYFVDSFAKEGEVVANLNYVSGDQDFSAALTQIISEQPDILFIPAYFAEGAIIMKQARELGAEFRIMGGDAMDNPETVKIGGEAVEGFLHTTFPYDVDMPVMSDAAKKFTEQWRVEHPDKEPNVNSVLGYTSYMMIIKAIQDTGKTDSQSITDGLANIKNFDTPIGLMSINKTHDAELPIGVIEIKNGKRTYLGEVTPK